MTAPTPGSMAWMRCFHGDQFKRGAHVRVNGATGWIASTRGGLVNVRLFSTGARLTVRPHEVAF